MVVLFFVFLDEIDGFVKWGMCCSVKIEFFFCIDLLIRCIIDKENNFDVIMIEKFN